MGIFLNIDRIPWPLRVFSYILPGRFFVEAALARVFGESDDFSGAVRLADATSTELSSANAQIALEYNRTFFCPQSDTVCYASTGRDILNELHVRCMAHCLPLYARCHTASPPCTMSHCLPLHARCRTASPHARCHTASPSMHDVTLPPLLACLFGSPASL